MICGPSGVGKTLFLHIYKKLCREKRGDNCRIKTVNCSHFSGDLARSELFGHIKSAFTGAVQDKDGWIKSADNGILVLEEIGDLPKETQANLLTFIETGEFHKVGSTETEKASVKIVGATNRAENLRSDFRYRFFPVNIPPLYERRQDVLYYLACKFPHLIAMLAPWEIMTLLAHNWPGNVREIESLGRLLTCKQLIASEDAQSDTCRGALNLLESDIFALPAANSHLNNIELSQTGLGAIGNRDTTIKGYQAHQLYNNLQNFGIDVEYLETLLNRFHVGLLIHNKTCPLSHLKKYDPQADLVLDKRFDVAIYPPKREFNTAWLGFQALCTLLWSHEKENTNMLDTAATAFTIPFASANQFFDTATRNIALFNSMTAYIKKNKKDNLKLPAGTDLSIFNLAEIMKMYYRSLLASTGGNKTQAAHKAELKYSTFLDQLKKYDLK